MICPNCGTKMIESVYEDTDEAFDLRHDYKCPKCRVANLDGQGWSIPEELEPTEKQRRTVEFIHYRLGIPFDGNIKTKKEYHRFISEHFEDAKKKKHPVCRTEDKDWKFDDEIINYIPDEGYFC